MKEPLDFEGVLGQLTMDEMGVDAAQLCSLNELLARSTMLNVHAVVVARRGKLIYEAYFTGQDERWGDKLGSVVHTAEMPHDVRSISKSVVSLSFSASHWIGTWSLASLTRLSTISPTIQTFERRTRIGFSCNICSL
jgi:hypothetical protein